MAKKLGLDPMSIGQQAIANAKMNAQQRAMQKAGMGGGAGMGGMDAAQMQAMQQSMANGAVGARANSAGMSSAIAGNPGMAGYTQADVDALVAFQQEMMQLSMAASAGDERAKARLEAWEVIALKYQTEMQKLALAAGAGDVVAAQKMQRMQFDLIKEWNAAGSTRAKPTRAKKP